MPSVLKTAAQQQQDPTAYFVIETVKDVMVSKLLMLHLGGVTNLEQLLQLLIQCKGNLATFEVEINGKKYNPFTAEESDKFELALSKHLSTKDAFIAAFEIKEDSVPSPMQVAASGVPTSTIVTTTLRAGVIRLSRILDRQGTDEMLVNGKK